MRVFIIIILIILINVGFKQYKKFESKKRYEQRFKICMEKINDLYKCKHGIYNPIVEKLKDMKKNKTENK